MQQGQPTAVRAVDRQEDQVNSIETISGVARVPYQSLDQRGGDMAPFNADTASIAAVRTPKTEYDVPMKYASNRHGIDSHHHHVWATKPTPQDWDLWRLQLWGMLYKRFLCTIRNPATLLLQMICPALCILLVMCLQLVQDSEEGTLYLSPAVFNTQSEMQVSGCQKYMGDVARMHSFGHNLTEVSFHDPNFVNSRDMSVELLDRWFSHRLSRLMSLQCGDPAIAAFLGVAAPKSVGTRQVHTILFNTSSRISLPIALHTAYSLAYFGALGSSANAAEATYSMSLAGLPRDSNAAPARGGIPSFLIGIIVLIPFTFLPANPVAWVVREYESNARHLQRVSGLSHLIYWIGNFLFDFIAFVVIMILIIVTFDIFKRGEYAGHDIIGATVTSFFIYGACQCCFSYTVSFAFTEHSTAQITVLAISFLSGFLCVILVFVLGMLDNTLVLSNRLRWVFRLLPPYSVGEVILNLVFLEQKQVIDPSLTAWSMSITGWPDVYMAVEIPIFGAMTLLWDHPDRRAVVSHLEDLLAAPCRRFRCENIRRRSCPEHKKNHPCHQTTVPAEAASTVTASRDHGPLMTGNTDTADTAVYLQDPPRWTRAPASTSPLHPLNLWKTEQVMLPKRIYPLLRRFPAATTHPHKEDSDVEEERDAVYHVEQRHLAEQRAARKSDATAHKTFREAASGSRDVVRVVDLCKVYDSPRKVALNALTLSVMQGEVFAFLGTNGAGKSTALSIITQEQLPTSGCAYVCDHDVVRESRRAAEYLGYCPQFDACLDLLTVTEHLRLYAMIRGVSGKERDNLVTSLLIICDLMEHRHVMFWRLSGGNRRKLSVAIALVGAPKVLCLDEPTAGTDPLARQKLWSVLSWISRKCSIILTTHHLGEVETVADCVGIMVDGSLRCFGDPLHLKNKYACSAYQLTFRVSPTARRLPECICAIHHHRCASVAPGVALRNDKEPAAPCARCRSNSHQRIAGNDVIDAADGISQFMLKHFPAAQLVDTFISEQYIYTLAPTGGGEDTMQQMQHEHSEHGTFSPIASPQNMPLSKVVETLQIAKEKLGVTEYSVSQVSLGQVFLRLCNTEETYNRNRHCDTAIPPTTTTTTSAVRPTTHATDTQELGGVAPYISPTPPEGNRVSWEAQSALTGVGKSDASIPRQPPNFHPCGPLKGLRVTFAYYRRQRALRRRESEEETP